MSKFALGFVIGAVFVVGIHISFQKYNDYWINETSKMIVNELRKEIVDVRRSIGEIID